MSLKPPLLDGWIKTRISTMEQYTLLEPINAPIAVQAAPAKVTKPVGEQAMQDIIDMAVNGTMGRMISTTKELADILCRAFGVNAEPERVPDRRDEYRFELNGEYVHVICADRGDWAKAKVWFHRQFSPTSYYGRNAYAEDFKNAKHLFDNLPRIHLEAVQGLKERVERDRIASANMIKHCSDFALALQSWLKGSEVTEVKRIDTWDVGAFVDTANGYSLHVVGKRDFSNGVEITLVGGKEKHDSFFYAGTNHMSYMGRTLFDYKEYIIRDLKTEVKRVFGGRPRLIA